MLARFWLALAPFWLVLVVASSISGCSAPFYTDRVPPNTDDSDGSSSRVNYSQGKSSQEPEEDNQVQIKNSRPAAKSEEAVFAEMESLLVYRDRACRLPEESREQLLRGYQELDTPTAIMATLMLASCAPDKTPGLLANSLVAARELEHNTPGFNGLLGLLEAQLRSYSLIETELKKTRSRLEEMINGLRQIETEMGQDARGQE